MAAGIDDAAAAGKVRTAVMKILISKGRLREAEKMGLTITDPDMWADAQTAVVVGWTEAGMRAEAQRVARLDPPRRE